MCDTPKPNKPKRPGLVTFSAILMFVIGGIQLLLALSEFTDASWLLGRSMDLVGDEYVVMAIVDLVIGLTAIFSGFYILRGGEAGRILGITIAIVDAIRWFILMPGLPVAAIVGMTLNLIAIYGLSIHDEYFGQQGR